MGKFKLWTCHHFYKLGPTYCRVSSHGILSRVKHVPVLPEPVRDHRDVGRDGDLPRGAHLDVRLAHVVPEAECGGQEEIQES